MTIGIDYLTRLYQVLQESSTSTWINKKTSFDFIYASAKDLAKKTKSLHGSQTITTIAGTQAYDLNTDFMEILTDDGYDNKTIKYNDGTQDTWISWQPYKDTLSDDNTDAVDIPNSFSVVDSDTPTRIIGTATSGGSASGGESNLYDTNANFTCSVGDTIVNTTHSYVGYVLAVNSVSNLTTAMFDITSSGSPYVGWTTSDAYVIAPSSRYQIFLDAPPLYTGYTITVSYIKKPSPVYSDYGSYPFAMGYDEALIHYAVWLYKYRDMKPDFGDRLYKVYDMYVREARNVNKLATGKRSFKVSYIKR